MLRGLGVSAPATAVGVGAARGQPARAVTLHAGVSAGAPAAVWLMLAASFAVRQWGRAAILAALIAALTAPLAGAALLAMGAHLVLGGWCGCPTGCGVPVGGCSGSARSRWPRWRWVAVRWPERPVQRSPTPRRR